MGVYYREYGRNEQSFAGSETVEFFHKQSGEGIQHYVGK